MGTMNFAGVNQAAVTPNYNQYQTNTNYNGIGNNYAAQNNAQPQANVSDLVKMIQSLLNQLVQNNVVYNNPTFGNTTGNQGFNGNTLITPPLPNLAGTQNTSIFGNTANNGFAAQGTGGNVAGGGINGQTGAAGGVGGFNGFNNTGAGGFTGFNNTAAGNNGASIFNVSLPSLGSSNNATGGLTNNNAGQQAQAAPAQQTFNPSLTGNNARGGTLLNATIPTLGGGAGATATANQNAGGAMPNQGLRLNVLNGNTSNVVTPSLGGTQNTGTQNNGIFGSTSIPSLGNGNINAAQAPATTGTLFNGTIPSLTSGQSLTTNSATRNTGLTPGPNGTLLSSSSGIPSLGSSIRTLSGELGLPTSGNNNNTGSHWTN